MGAQTNVSKTLDEIHRYLNQIIANNALILEQLQRGFASVHEVLDQRLKRLEETVSRHSKILEGRDGAA